jgi:GAF domain-containing protein
METLARCAGSAITNLRLQKKLAQDRERMMVAFEQANLWTWMLDMEELALSASLACKSHFGREANERFSYADLMTLLHAEGQQELQSAISHLASRGGQFEMVTRVDWKDGTTRKVELRGYAEPELNEPARRIMGFCREMR